MQTKKSLLVTLLLFSVALVISTGFVFLQYNLDILHNNVNIAYASPTGNITGYAWSPNSGWISMSCSNPAPDDCNVSSYGVQIDSATGNFSGYAWSSIYGWINFAPSGATPDGGSTARWNSGTGEVSGWAKIEMLGNSGWIKMRDNVVPFGVTIDPATGIFRGWAANFNTDGSGIGWISFNSLDRYPGSPEYQAKLILSPVPNANSIVLKDYAWSPNAGYISMNCQNDPPSCTNSNYSVFFDYLSGDFSGFAWSSAFGWIDFSPDGTPPASGGKAHYSSSTNAITGWAKILSLGDDGWISLNCSNTGTCATANYGVSIDTALGQLKGFAWNYNTAASGVGWISFNTRDCDADFNHFVDNGKCNVFNNTTPIATYNVTYIVPVLSTPNITGFTQLSNPGDTLKTVTINWNNTSPYATGYTVRISSDQITWTNDWCTNNGAGATSCSGLVPFSAARYYQVAAKGILGSQSGWSTPATSFTTAYNAPLLNLTGVSNCDQIQLIWTNQGLGISYYQIFKASSTGPVMIANNVSSAATSYTDNDVESGTTYQYFIRAQTNPILDSNTISMKPCPALPKWREVPSQ